VSVNASVYSEHQPLQVDWVTHAVHGL